VSLIWKVVSPAARRFVQFLHHRDHGVEVFLGVGGNNQTIGRRLAGDSHLAIEAADVPVRLRLRIKIIIVIRPLHCLLEKQFVRTSSMSPALTFSRGTILGARLLSAIGSSRAAMAFGDALHGGGGSLHQDGVAAAVGHDADLLGTILSPGLPP